MDRRNRTKRKLNKSRFTAGYTLAELLIVVAIVGILTAFGIVGVVGQVRRLHLTEMNDVAQEIFVAAQNHLTESQASGEWARYYEAARQESEGSASTGLGDRFDRSSDTSYPTEEIAAKRNLSVGELRAELDGADADGTKHHDWRYLAVPTYDALEDGASALAYMLPLGAIDPSVRNGGTYVIEYDAANAAVYGVFYTEASGVTGEQLEHAVELLDGKIAGGPATGREDAEARQYFDFSLTGAGSVKGPIGYYGGASVYDVSGSKLAQKASSVSLTIRNEERLMLLVSVRTDEADMLRQEILDQQLQLQLHDQHGNTIVLDQASYGAFLKASNKNGVSSRVDSMTEPTTVRYGITSKEQYTYKNYAYILDSVVDPNRHFQTVRRTDASGLHTGSGLILGDDIYATASLLSGHETNEFGSGLRTPADSDILYTSNTANSLFANGSDYSDAAKRDPQAGVDQILVKNARHLENLSSLISGYDRVQSVSLQNDITWDATASADAETFGQGRAFLHGLAAEDQVYHFRTATEDGYAVYAANGTVGETGKYYGMVSTSLQEFNGNDFTLRNFTIASGNEALGTHAGILSQITDTKSLTIHDLKLEHVSAATDAHATAQGATGGLLGFASIPNGAVRIARVGVDGGANGMLSGNGSVGGLLGDISAQTCEVTDCYASVLVENLATAASSVTGVPSTGGFVGSLQTSGRFVLDRVYASGRTNKRSYGNRAYYNRNVFAASGSVGGLIGVLKGGSTGSGIYDSYTTCSVRGDGTNAAGYGGIGIGGFLGSDREVTGTFLIQNCYSTGLVTAVQGTVSPNMGVSLGRFQGIHAHAASGASAATAVLNYCLNQLDGNTGALIGTELESVNRDAELVVGAETEEEGTPFVSTETAAAAVPYDRGLSWTYAYRTTAQLAQSRGNAVGVNSYNSTHIGDWPVVMKKGQMYKGDVGILYYEVVQHGAGREHFGDRDYYFHGYVGSMNANGDTKYFQEIWTNDGAHGNARMDYANNGRGLLIGHDQYVVEEGYLVLVNDALAEEYRIGKSTNYTQYHDYLCVTVNDETDSSARALNKKLDDGTAVQYDDLLSYDKLNITGYHAYVLTLNNNYVQNSVGKKSLSIEVRKGDTWRSGSSEMKESAKFWYQPMFSDTLWNRDVDTTKQPYQVRSAQQLKKMFGDLNYKVDAIYGAGNNTTNTLLQTLDISYDSNKVQFSRLGDVDAVTVDAYQSPLYSQGNFSIVYQALNPQKVYDALPNPKPVLEESLDQTSYKLDGLSRQFINAVGTNGNAVGKLKDLYITDSHFAVFVNEIHSGGEMDHCTFENINQDEHAANGKLITNHNGSISNCVVRNYKGNGFISNVNATATIQACTLEHISLTTNDDTGYLFGTLSGNVEDCTINGIIGRGVASYISNNNQADKVNLKHIYINKGDTYADEHWRSSLIYGLARQNAGSIQACEIYHSTLQKSGMVYDNDKTIADCRIEACVIESGGGIADDNAGTITNSVVSSCTITGAGVVRADSGPIQNSYVENCAVTGAGFVWFNSGLIQDSYVENCTISDAGFVRENTYGGNIQSSRVDGAYTSIGGSGFADVNYGIIQNSTVQNISDIQKDGFVSQNIRDQGIQNCSVQNASIAGNGFVGECNGDVSDSAVIHCTISQNGFVGEINQGKVISGCRVVNVIAGGAGFAGKIDSEAITTDCHVYADPDLYQQLLQSGITCNYHPVLTDPTQAYALVVVGNTIENGDYTDVAGFANEIDTNYRNVAFCSFTGTVIGRNVAGFVLQHKGKLERCYANAILVASERGSASGFASVCAGGSSIETSFAAGLLAGGASEAGFVGRAENQASIQHSYTGIWGYEQGLLQAGKVGPFCLTNQAGDLSGNLFVSDLYPELSAYSNANGTPVTAEELKTQTFEGRMAPDVQTIPYGQYCGVTKLDVYPYPVPIIHSNERGSLTFYGDWFQKTEAAQHTEESSVQPAQGDSGVPRAESENAQGMQTQNTETNDTWEVQTQSMEPADSAEVQTQQTESDIPATTSTPQTEMTEAVSDSTESNDYEN